MAKKIYLIIIGVVILGIIAGGIVLNSKNQKPPYDFITAQKQDIVQEVSVTGKVKPSQNVQLSFDRSGRIINVFKQVGEKVSSGDYLVELENYDLKAQLAQAQAAVDLQTANLEELKKGARPEEVQVSQTAVDNAKKSLEAVNFTAQTSLDNLYDDVKDTLNQAFIYADDAVNKQTLELFNDPSTDKPSLKFQVSVSQIKNDAEWQRTLSRNSLSVFKTELFNITANSQDQLDSELVRAEGYLEITKNYLNALNDALVFSAGIDQTTKTTYQGYVYTSRTNVSTAITSVSSLKQSIASQKATNKQNIDTAQSTLDTAQRNLELKKAGATIEQVQSQEAQLKQARANVANIQAQIAKTILKSPISGIVSKMDAKQGEISQAQNLVAEVISQAQFQIEANVPEADVAKIKIGNASKVTLDAYGDAVIFEAKIIKIEPSATVVEGVPTYKTTLEFTQENDKIKSGMTANLDILTAKETDALAVPYRAVTDKSGEKFVQVLKDNNKIEERKVTTGLRGSDGNIQIIEGIAEGEKIITFNRTKQ